MSKSVVDERKAQVPYIEIGYLYKFALKTVTPPKEVLFDLVQHLQKNEKENAKRC